MSQPNVKFRLMLALKISVSLVACAYLITKINASHVIESLFQVPLGFTSLVLGCGCLQVFFMGVRWWYLQGQNNISFQDALRFSWMGHFFSLVTPAGILGSDVVRVFYLKGPMGNWRHMTRLMVIEKIGMLLSLFFLVIPYLSLHYSLLFLGALPFLIIVSYFLSQSSMLSTSPKEVIFISCVINIISAFSFYILAVFFSPDLSFWSVFVVVPLATLIGSLPISFGGWGIREGANVYFLMSLGLSVDNALTVSILLSVTALLASLPGFVTWLHIRKEKKKLCVAS